MSAARRLMTVPGIGPLAATALLAAAGNGQQFRKARDMAAWLGLVPQQYSTGGKTTAAGHQQARQPLRPPAADPWSAILRTYISIERAIGSERGSPSLQRACTSTRSPWRSQRRSLASPG